MSRIRQRREVPVAAQCDRRGCSDPWKLEVEGHRVCEGWICRYWAVRTALDDSKVRLVQTVFDGFTFAAVLFFAGVVVGLVLNVLMR